MTILMRNASPANGDQNGKASRSTQEGVLHGIILAHEAARHAVECAQECPVTSPWRYVADELLEATRKALARAVLLANGVDVHPAELERPGFRWEATGARSDDYTVAIAPHVGEDGETDYRLELASVIVLEWSQFADLQDRDHALEMATAAVRAERRAVEDEDAA